MSNLKPDTVVIVNGVLAIVTSRQAACYRVEFADGSNKLCVRRMFVVSTSRALALDFWIARYNALAGKINNATAAKHRVDRLVSKLRLVYLHHPGPQLAPVSTRIERASTTNNKLVSSQVTGDIHHAAS